MKAFRISASILALTVLSVLAACGGGGGGGGGVNPPGGGGGGGPTPTPAPTGSPTPGPTQAPTTPPPSPAPTGSPGGVAVNAGLTVNAEENFVNGNQNWYNSGSASWTNGSGIHSAGDTSTSGATGSGFEGMTCADTQEGTAFPAGKFTQHAFVGIYNSSGQEEALPQALGMINPVPPVNSTPQPSPANPSPTPYPNNNYEVEQYQCEYNVHTHDYSGLVHLEDTTQNQSLTPPAYGTLQTLIDEWGATLNAQSGLTAGASTLNGAVTIYVGTPNANGLVNSYSVFSGSPSTLVLNHHTVVWIVVGTTAASIPPIPGQSQPVENGLPQVQWKIVN